MHESPNKRLSRIPKPGKSRIAIRVVPAAERAIRRGHPWLFENSITSQNQDGDPGTLGVIFDKARKFLAIGLYDPTSPIRVRILAHKNPVPINQSFLQTQLHTAFTRRSTLPGNTTGYRMVHGGNDSLPGLVIDRYSDTAVIKLYTPAWIPYLQDIINGLSSISKWKRVILRLSRKTQLETDFLFGLNDGVTLLGSHQVEPIVFQENGLWFEVDPIQGHKTGFYLDQRDNRQYVGKISKGSKVLNVFSYTGGFSLYAARGSAAEIVSIDISKPALNSAKRNFSHNDHDPKISACNHKVIVGDAFQVLPSFLARGEEFDIVIIDPPSFANNQSQVQRAMAAYKILTELGIQLLRINGILFQSSCSSQIKPEVFYTSIHEAANIAGFQLREVKRTAHPIDHPVGFKEGAYLKSLFAAKEQINNE